MSQTTRIGGIHLGSDQPSLQCRTLMMCWDCRVTMPRAWLLILSLTSWLALNASVIEPSELQVLYQWNGDMTTCLKEWLLRINEKILVQSLGHCQQIANVQRINGGHQGHQTGFCHGHTTGWWPIQTWTWFELGPFQVLFWYHLPFPLLELVSPGLSTLVWPGVTPPSLFPPPTQQGNANIAVCCALISAADLFRGDQIGGRAVWTTYQVKVALGRGCWLSSPFLAGNEQSAEGVLSSAQNPCELACH